jgi:predicted GIY-YIG superfamily endonuclease
MGNKPTVYLLHFHSPYWGNCQHYCGYTILPLQERLVKHRNGSGSKLVHYAVSKDIDFVVGNKWEMDTKQDARKWELKLKRNRLARYCNICRKEV